MLVITEKVMRFKVNDDKINAFKACVEFNREGKLK